MAKTTPEPPTKRWRKCQTCNGRCTVLVPVEGGKFVRETCPACKGQGGQDIGLV